jgi:glycosyltransferase involved in cell wall biosynthesis
MSMSNIPSVSVIIPVYNGCTTIERAVESVRLQSYRDFEIIVVDDGSTDGSAAFIAGLGDLKVITQPNQGCLVARQAGVSVAQGEFLAFLDQDDYWVADKLEQQVRTLQKHPEAVLVFGNLEAVDDAGKSRRFMVAPSQFCHAPSWEDLLLMFPLYPSSSLVRRTAFVGVGGFDPRFGGSGAYGDQDMHLRLREAGPFLFVNKKVGFYYWDERRSGRSWSFLKNLMLFAEKHYGHPRLGGQRGQAICQRFIWKCCAELSYHAKCLLELHKGAVTVELVRAINQYHRSLETTFGRDYRRYGGLSPLDLSKFPTDDGTRLLVFLYLYRRELQGMFPEALYGDLRRLAQWALGAAAERSSDPDRDFLRPWRDRLESLAGNLVPPKTRFDLAKQLHGSGVEIGALDGALHVEGASRVFYVDIDSPELLKKRHGSQGSVKLDVLSDCEHLAIRDSSLDFLIANHVLEHLVNPIGTLLDWLRCLKPGGRLLMAVPDKRYSFDKPRDSTSIGHLVQDFRRSPSSTDLQGSHAEEWAERIDGLVPGTEVFAGKVKALLQGAPMIHKHVWTSADFQVFLEFLTDHGFPLRIVEFSPATESYKEFVCLLEKYKAGSLLADSLLLDECSDAVVRSYDLVSEARRKIQDSEEYLRETWSDIAELNAIKRSLGYRLMRSQTELANTLMPYGTRRGGIRAAAVASLRVISQEGFVTWLGLAFAKIKRRDFRFQGGA